MFPSLACRSRVRTLKRLQNIRNVSTKAVAPSRIPPPSILQENGTSKPLLPEHSAGSRARYDVVLSSGFLAFANHAGFLQAVEDSGIEVSGVMGTSAGALAGSLYCAGYTPKQVVQELCRVPPIRLLRPTLTPWEGGVMSLDGVVQRLRMLLPARFDDLPTEFACGVVGPNGEHYIVDRGSLPEAVAASAAVPFLFAGVKVPGLKGPCKDGGCTDRVGLSAWRDRRRKQLQAVGQPESEIPHALVHVITRSSPFSGADDLAATGESRWTVVKSPKSGVSLLDLGNWEEQMQGAYGRAMATIPTVTVDHQD